MGQAMNFKIISQESNKNMARHYIDVLVWLTNNELMLLKKDQQKQFILSMVKGIYDLDQKPNLTKEEKQAFGKLYSIDSVILKIYLRMILTGCAEQEAFNYVGGGK